MRLSLNTAPLLSLSLSRVFHLAKISFLLSLSLHLQTPFNLFHHLLLFYLSFLCPIINEHKHTHVQVTSLPSKLLIGQNCDSDLKEQDRSCCVEETRGTMMHFQYRFGSACALFVVKSKMKK